VTNLVTRYQLEPKGIGARLVLLDTMGYGHEGPREDQIKATEEAAQKSDVMLLVLHARNPARAADVQMLDRLKDWYATHPELRRPPIIGVVTHVDLLSPAMEWEPPYDWRNGTRLKEQQIRLALQAAADQFGPRLAAIVPICGTAGKVYGIDEELLPVLVEKLGEARAVAFLRVLRAEADAGKTRKVVEQMMRAGKEIVNIVWQNVKA
jgi:predicted GTPase